MGALSWAAATAAGLSALISAAPVLYEVLHLAGAGYLGYLGVSALLRVRRGQQGAPPAAVWNRRGPPSGPGC